MVINFFWILLLTVFSIITDLFIFCNISNIYKRNKITIWVIGLIAILLAIFDSFEIQQEDKIIQLMPLYKFLLMR